MKAQNTFEICLCFPSEDLMPATDQFSCSPFHSDHACIPFLCVHVNVANVGEVHSSWHVAVYHLATSWPLRGWGHTANRLNKCHISIYAEGAPPCEAYCTMNIKQCCAVDAVFECMRILGMRMMYDVKYVEFSFLLVQNRNKNLTAGLTNIPICIMLPQPAASALNIKGRFVFVQ